jgi:hypothetical protein
MSPSILPLISERDYPAFQRMIPELRHTDYEEWADDHRKAIAYRQSRNGFVEIPFSPAEFDGWLHVKKEAAHMELLWAFAEHKGAGLLRTG